MDEAKYLVDSLFFRFAAYANSDPADAPSMEFQEDVLMRLFNLRALLGDDDADTRINLLVQMIESLQGEQQLPDGIEQGTNFPAR